MELATGTAATLPAVVHRKMPGKAFLILLSLLILLLMSAGIGLVAGVPRSLPKYLRGAVSCCTARQLAPFADDPGSLAALTKMLNNTTDQPYWENAVLALGVLAPYTENLAEHFLEFVSTPDEFDANWEWSGDRVPVRRGHRGTMSASARDVPISEGLFAAKMRGLVACGNLLNRLSRTDNKAAVPPASLERLIERTDPEFWQENVRWRSAPHFADDQERNSALAGEAIKALAISGFPAAETALHQIRDTASPKDPLISQSLNHALLCIQNHSCTDK
jgi:hypothetical protein